MEITDKEYNKLKRFWDTAHRAKRKWEEKNKEKRKEYMRQWQKSHKEHLSEYQKKYRQKVDNTTTADIIGESKC